MWCEGGSWTLLGVFCILGFELVLVSDFSFEIVDVVMELFSVKGWRDDKCGSEVEQLGL